MCRRTVWLLLGVVLWAVCGVGICHSLHERDVPLRVGMRPDEVRAILGNESDYWPESGRGDDWGALYLGKPDVLGNYQDVTVHFDGNDKVVRWEEETWTLSFRDWWDQSLRPFGL